MKKYIFAKKKFFFRLVWLKIKNAEMPLYVVPHFIISILFSFKKVFSCPKMILTSKDGEQYLYDAINAIFL